jgi:hypothetical protein
LLQYDERIVLEKVKVFAWQPDVSRVIFHLILIHPMMAMNFYRSQRRHLCSALRPLQRNPSQHSLPVGEHQRPARVVVGICRAP